MRSNTKQLIRLTKYGHPQRFQKAKSVKVKRSDSWSTYAEYLQTAQWQYLRQRMLVKAGYRCNFCQSPSRLHVHHRTYDRVGKEPLSDLVVLCPTCHERVHETRKRHPDLSLTEATSMVKRLVNK